MGSDDGSKKSRPNRFIVSCSRDAIMFLLGATFASVALLMSASNNHPQSYFKQLTSHHDPTITIKSKTTASSFSSSSDGWKTLNVFYGATNILTDTIPNDYRLIHVENNKNGNRWFGQFGQDVAVAKFFRFKQQGYFIDLAANHAVWASNTFALEQNYDWKGICIEPNSYYWRDLSFRKCDIVNAIIGEKDMEQIGVNMASDKGRAPYSGIVRKDFKNKRKSENDQQWYTVSLERILETFGAPNIIDFLSLDVEGAEEFIMSTFPFDKYRFLTLVIESPQDGLRRMLEKWGYKEVWKFKRGEDVMYAHESVYEEGKLEVERNSDEIDSHRVTNWPS